jgi:uncharacterized linocin/CFP29 family protein
MNDLRREQAPISSEGWAQIDQEARRALETTLAARKLVDFSGPHGWSKSAVGIGRVKPLGKAPAPEVEAALRQVQPLIELRATFEVSRAEIDAIGRGAKDPDVESVRQAACRIAFAEDSVVFRGYPEGQITGMCEAAAPTAVTLTDDYERYPASVAEALDTLRRAGVDGPYALALGPRCYAGLSKTVTKAGYLMMHMVQRLLDGPIVWAPAVDGAVVVSLRGGDFELVVGRDLAIGYLDHSATDVRLYLEESVTFRVLASEAAVPLTYAAAKGKG